MPHSIHVWLTVWAWWTKEHATNEGMNKKGVCMYDLIFYIEGVIYSDCIVLPLYIPHSLNLNGEKSDL